MTETELAKQVAVGDQDASAHFVHAHYEAVYRLTLRLTGNKDDSEDLTQQTFIKAKQKIGGFKGGSNLRTWIHRIAFNEYKQWRRRQRWTGRLDIHQPTTGGVSQFEDGFVLAEAIGKLPEKLRQVFILYEVEQLDMKQVAQVLGIPEGTAKARASYARTKLRQLLQEHSEVKNDEIKVPAQ